MCKMNTSVDLEKLLGHYDLVRCVIGDRVCVGGAKLLQVVASQSRHQEPVHVVERRLLQLTQFAESGLVARPGRAASVLQQQQQSSGQIGAASGVAGLVFYLDKTASSRKLLAEKITAALSSEALAR